MDNEIIKALRNNNWMNYGGWTSDMKDVANEIGYSNFIKRCDPDSWMFIPGGFKDFSVYCLRADYQAKPEIVECEVRLNPPSKDYYCYDKGGNYSAQPLCNAVNDPDFIGFKYEDDRMHCESKRSPFARLYISKQHGDTIEHLGSDVYDDYDVLTPTHVLFREA